MPEVLDTDRLVLRKLKRADVPILHRIFGDAESMRYYPRSKTLEETFAWFEKLAFQSYAENDFGLWGIVEKAGGELIGDCGITLQKTPSGLEPEIGYHLRREWLGRGYAIEAASACRDYGLTKLRFRRVVSIVSPENVPSLHVAARIHHRWETYRTVTSAGADADRFLFISENVDGPEMTDAGARIAAVEAEALRLRRGAQC
ncbi:RimJ/RimL family protein N-acetyltransferase [Rhizobium petrolearium]|uniref:GNAT family N-acetyltransferase n=1 Tax=Neorhizobium petrolearium TaxID=515361 RepID=UPI001AEA1668|nr:GNAT family N-acetyltransferase [Neorhizobium petrolearium]MBP1846287.1 RimJ/RimL family protein N-acetyltransferase [Neorhizobium petrolearium]